MATQFKGLVAATGHLAPEAKTDLAADISDATTAVGAAVAGVATGGAVDLTEYVTDSELSTALSSKADTADVPAVPPVASIPFVVKWDGTAWPYATLADAQAAGLDTTQTVWFIGNTGGTMPTWARDGDVWTQG